MSRKNYIILIFILFGLSASLISAYVIEYGFGHKPCKLCIYQRFPYIVSILLLLNILLFKKNVKFYLLILAIVSLIGSFLAFYHLDSLKKPCSIPK